MEKKAISPAQKKAYKKYIEGTDEIRIRAPKGMKQTITEYLLQSGETMQEFVLRATVEMMENEKLKKEQYDRLCAYNEAFARMREKKKGTAQDNAPDTIFGKTIITELDRAVIRRESQNELIKNMIMAGYTTAQITQIAPMYSLEEIEKLAATISDEERQSFLIVDKDV